MTDRETIDRLTRELAEARREVEAERDIREAVQAIIRKYDGRVPQGDDVDAIVDAVSSVLRGKSTPSAPAESASEPAEDSAKMRAWYAANGLGERVDEPAESASKDPRNSPCIRRRVLLTHCDREACPDGCPESAPARGGESTTPAEALAFAVKALDQGDVACAQVNAEYAAEVLGSMLDQPARGGAVQWKVGDRVVTPGGKRVVVVAVRPDDPHEAFPVRVRYSDGSENGWEHDELRAAPEPQPQAQESARARDPARRIFYNAGAGHEPAPEAPPAVAEPAAVEPAIGYVGPDGTGAANGTIDARPRVERPECDCTDRERYGAHINCPVHGIRRPSRAPEPVASERAVAAEVTHELALRLLEMIGDGANLSDRMRAQLVAYGRQQAAYSARVAALVTAVRRLKGGSPLGDGDSFGISDALRALTEHEVKHG